MKKLLFILFSCLIAVNAFAIPPQTIDANGVYCGGNFAPFKHAAVNTSTADTTLVAAVTDKRIVVMAYKLTGDDASGTMRFESGTGGTALTGAMLTEYGAAVINGELSDSCFPYGCFATAAGALLNLEQKTTDDIDGYVIYVECD